MKKFFIHSNEIKDPDFSMKKRVGDYLIKKGASVCQSAVEAECILVLGGDGTLIGAAGKYANVDAVFAGINLGTIGYLTDIEPDSLEESLDKLIIDDFSLEERMMLRAMLERDGEAFNPIALNDVVINRSGSLCILEYAIYVNDKYLTSLRADGIIVSTPTGSTGYSLSAGGPIVDPRSDLMIITPICPQSLSARPIILSSDSSIRVEILKGGESVEASFDGKDNTRLFTGDSVKISKSGKTTKIARIKDESFVEIMRHKLIN